MLKILSIVSLVLTIILFPPAALALVSNNAVPGQATYPIKRGLEDVIFAVASLNSSTKAWFSAARSDRRFQEVQILATDGKVENSSLQELVSQTDTTAQDISKIVDGAQKKQLLDNLSQSIQKYNAGLNKISNSLPDQTTNPSKTVSSATPAPQSNNPATVQTPNQQATPIPTAVPVSQHNNSTTNSNTAAADDLARQRQAIAAAQQQLADTQRQIEAEAAAIQQNLQRQQAQQQVQQQQSGQQSSQSNQQSTQTQQQNQQPATQQKSPQQPVTQPTAPPVKQPTPSSDTSNLASGTNNIVHTTNFTPARIVDSGNSGNGFDTQDGSNPPAPTNPPIPTATPITEPVCVSPPAPTDLSYKSDTKTVSWTASTGATHYNVRLVNPNGDEFDYNDDPNPWYTFPDNAIPAQGNYSWWTDSVNDCGVSRAGSTFTISGS